MQSNGQATLELHPPYRAGNLLVCSVSYGGETIHTDAIEPCKAKHREKYWQDLLNRKPGLEEYQEEVEKWLLEMRSPGQNKDDKPKETGPKYSPEIVCQAEELLTSDKLVSVIVQDLLDIGISGETELAMAIYLVGVSRLLPRPLSAIVQGPTSSGKSYVVATVGDMFPPSAVIDAKQMTPQALFHMKPGSLIHKFIVSGERSRAENDETAEATRALREMLSSGKLTKLMPVKMGKEIETVLIEQQGPIAYVESTTLSKIFDEDANRSLLFGTDERSEQTRRIIDNMAANYSGQGMSPEDRQAIIDKHHCLQSLLESIPVVIPFAEQVGQHFPTKKVECRRAFPQTMGMVQASALLHQRQRERDSSGSIIATKKDYEVARKLLLKPLSRGQGGLSDGARRMFDVLKNESGGEEFTTAQARKWGDFAKSSVKGWVIELYEGGLLELVQESRGRRAAVWKVHMDGNPDLVSGYEILPSSENIIF